MILYTCVIIEVIVRFINENQTSRSINLIGWAPRCCLAKRNQGPEREIQMTTIPPLAIKDDSSPYVEAAADEPVHAQITNRVHVKILLACCSFATLLIFIR
jgi:hypothetical protein